MKTYVTLILDRSGSMHTISEQAVEGYNQQIRAFKETALNQDVHVSLVSFNGEVFEHYWTENVDVCKESEQGDYHPAGSTALWDAMGYTINKLEETTDPTGDVAYLVVVISDGEENASKHIQSNALFEKISKLQETKKWTFTFMGCSENYLKEVAKTTGIPISNCAAWSNADGEKARASFYNHSERTAKYMQLRAAGEVKCCNYYSDDLDMDKEFAASAEYSGKIINLADAPPANMSATSSSYAAKYAHAKKDAIFSKGQRVNW